MPLEERIVVEVEAIEDEILAWLVPRLADWVLAQTEGVRRLIDDRATTATRKLFSRLFMIHARFLVFCSFRPQTLRPSDVLSGKRLRVLQKCPGRCNTWPKTALWKEEITGHLLTRKSRGVCHAGHYEQICGRCDRVVGPEP